jgi:predicted Zn-dependent peptidase
MADRVMEGLSAYADVVQRPHMGEEDFLAARDLALQALEGIDDEPRQKVFILLRQWHFPWPFGRNTMGEKRDLTKLTADACRTYQRRTYPAKGAILAIAGKIDFDALVGQAEKHFGQWASTAEKPIKTVLPKSLVHHERHASEQTHIGIAWPSVEETHGDYYLMRLATEVLGGGMSGRLFTEVREKRALVYSVWAGYSSIKGSGSILGYAGTSNDRAQATLDTFIAEARRLSEGVTAGELDRAKVGLKAATIMQLESTSSRCGSIAHDFFMRGRIRTLDEIKGSIDSVTLGQVNEFLKRTPPGPFTIVTVGPKQLKVPA